MDMIRLAVAVVMVLIALWLIVVFVRDYTVAIGTPWQRALTASRESATMLWGKIVMLVGLLSTGLVSAADYLNDPTLAEAIKAWLQPAYVTTFVMVVAMVTLFARMRTLPPKSD